MSGPFEFKLFQYFNTANNSIGTESKKFKTAFMKLNSLKLLSKLKHVKHEVTLIAAFSMEISR